MPPNLRQQRDSEYMWKVPVEWLGLFIWGQFDPGRNRPLLLKL
jgi:hypothetical protein